MYVCMYVCMHACMHACMHVCMHACMYACLYVCIYVCMYRVPFFGLASYGGTVSHVVKQQLPWTKVAQKSCSTILSMEMTVPSATLSAGLYQCLYVRAMSLRVARKYDSSSTKEVLLYHVPLCEALPVSVCKLLKSFQEKDRRPSPQEVVTTTSLQEAQHQACAATWRSFLMAQRIST